MIVIAIIVIVMIIRRLPRSPRRRRHRARLGQAANIIVHSVAHITIFSRLLVAYYSLYHCLAYSRHSL